MKRGIVILVVCAIALAVSANATIINVPDDQPTIQSGIDASVDDDTVLVHPGTYVENINFNGHNIVLGSLFLTTGDEAHISATIIDGNSSGSVISSSDDETNDAQIIGFTIQNGSYSEGGGIYLSHSSPTIRHNIIVNNIATVAGGGIHCGHSDAVIQYNTIRGNSAINSGNGGGIRASYGSLDIRYNLISENSGVWGGGIYVNNNSLVLRNNTISDNTASLRGGGIACNGNQVTITSSILWGNYSVDDPEISLYNAATATVSYTDIQGGYIGDGNLDVDPLFVGGDPFDYHLQFASPCIDAGDPDPDYNDPDGTRNDMGAFYVPHGFPLPNDINFGPDNSDHIVYTFGPDIYWTFYDTTSNNQAGYQIQVGTDTDWDVAEMWDSGVVWSADTNAAYVGLPLEFHVEYYLRVRVNNGLDWGNWGNNWFYVGLALVPQDHSTIQEGIDAAWDQDIVTVSQGTYYEHINFLGKAIIVKSLEGPEITIISKVYDGVPIVTFESGEDTSSVLDGFTIQNAQDASAIEISPSSSATIQGNIVQSNDVANGGGIKCGSNSKIVLNVIRLNVNSYSYGGGIICRSDNQIELNIFASNSSAGKGGGIYSNGSRNRIVKNVFYDNQSNDGGGAICLIAGNGHTIAHNLIYGNRAYNEYGGVVYTEGTGNVELTNNTVAYNLSSSGGGAGLALLSAFNWQVRNNIIVANTGGYGIYLDNPSNVSMTYNDVHGNESGNYYGGIPGTGSISEDPLFLDSNRGDYSLTGGSPCIDAGDPADPYDPDGTIADMGAFSFDQTYRVLNFHLIEPIDEIILLDPIPSFIWHSTEDNGPGYPIEYYHYLDDDPFFDTPFESVALDDTTYDFSEELARSLEYYWRVLATNNDAPPTYSSETWSFYIDGYPTMPEIIAPENGSVADASTYLIWLISTDPDSFDAVTYSIQVDDDPLFASPEIDESGLTSGLLLDDAFAVELGQLGGFENLQENQTYYWRIRSDDNYGLSSEWTPGPNFFTFVISAQVPTLSEWGMIIFGLLFLAVGTAAVIRRQMEAPVDMR